MKKSLRPILALMLLALLTACADRPKKYVIGVSQCSMDSWREKFLDELQNMALINDSVTLHVATANDDDQQQKAQIDSLARMGVDLLIVSPNQQHTISPAIDRAIRQGIPVVLYDRKTDSQGYTAFIGCDNRQIGRAMGQYIAQQLGGHGRVAEIMGLEGSSPAIERHRGFVEALSQWPGIELVATATGDWKEQSGSKAMRTLLGQTSQLDYVFCHNDRMACGARRTAAEAGLEQHIRFTGVDALASDGGGLELVRDGKLDASYLYPTKGNEVLALAMKILTGKPYERDNYLQATIVTHGNAELTLMEAKDAERQRQDLGVLHGQVDGYVAQYESQKVITIALIVILALLVAIVVVVYRSLIDKQRFNEKMVELTHQRLVFFTNISHELRTPLTLISDPVELLLSDTTISDRQRGLLTMVQRNARSLQQLVTSILDFRKVQNGKMSLSLSRFDIVEALTTWVSDFRLPAERRQISVQLDTAAFTPPTEIVADQEKVARIVFNLMSNALKYTPKGGRITVALHDGQTGTLHICVSDTGRGIAPEDAAHIFERFFQTKGTAGGTGIGLALVKAFAELHHGTASVESQPQQGSTFTVVLPREQKGTPEATATNSAPEQFLDDSEPQQPTTKEKSTDAPTLLIIDDNSDIRQYLQTILGSRYNIIEATDGKEGLEMAERNVPDLVVCDVMMPVMDGLEFCARLKSATPTSHIPVIMLTAKSMDEHRAEGYEQGADSYITKPFQSRVLLARIDNLLRQRALLRQRYSEMQTSVAGTQTPTDVPQASSTSTQASLIDKPASSTAAEEKPALAPREAAFMRQVGDIIDRHLADSDFSVEDIGQEIGLSRVQLYRKVKALTGTSVVDLLRRSRLQRARHLLATTASTVSEVGYATGFSSPSYFAKCFKDEYGQTPGEFAAQAGAQ